MSAGSARPSLREAANAALDAYIKAPPLEGVRTPITQRRGLMARLRQLEASHDGEKAAAAAAGVTPDTWRKWKRGIRKPRAASLAAVQGAYDRDLQARSQSPARVRAAARAMVRGGHIALVAVEAEVQWSGYYNGQVGGNRRGPTVAANEEQAPQPGNSDAHRWLNLTDQGDTDIGPLVEAWLGRRDTGDALEALANRYFGYSDQPGEREIFLNTYYHGATVTISEVQSE